MPWQMLPTLSCWTLMTTLDLKSNMRYILRYYEELIWSKYCDEILRGKIHTDFIRMDVLMFKVNPNIHYILIASLPGDLNWDNSVNRLLLNPGGLRKKLELNISPPHNENLPLTSPWGKISNSPEAVFGIHIVHINPPLKIRVGFERKYLKIGHIALLLTH